MTIRILAKNYRCFDERHALKIDIGEGFVSILGSNNSGKSTVLRFFYELRALFSAISNPHNNRLHSSTRFDIKGSLDNSEIFHESNNRDIQISIQLINPPAGRSYLPIPNEVTIILTRNDIGFAKIKYYINNEELITDGSHHLNDNVYLYNNRVEADVSTVLEVFRNLSSTFYIPAFRNPVNSGGNSYYDIPIGKDFISNWNYWKCGNNRSHNSAIIELTEQVRRIFEFSSLEINATPDGTTLNLSIDNKPYKLHEVGSGIAHFIMTLGSVAMKDNSYILIDEPETGLHPSLQVDFLTTLGTYAREGLIFSTHNVGLARSISDRIYSIRRLPDQSREMRDFDSVRSLAEFLGELSYSGYQNIGFDQILLVEGTTEVKTIQQFLRLYRLDHKIVLLPLGGSNLINGGRETELLEILRITSNIAAMVDSERSAELEDPHQSRLDFAESCSNVGITKCHILNRRSLENYLTERAVQIELGAEANALGNYEPLNGGWKKNQNWKIARHMTKEELDQTDLGAFLQSLVNP